MLHHVFDLDQMHIVHGGAFSMPTYCQMHWELLGILAGPGSNWHRV